METNCAKKYVKSLNTTQTNSLTWITREIEQIKRNKAKRKQRREMRKTSKEIRKTSKEARKASKERRKTSREARKTSSEMLNSRERRVQRRERREKRRERRGKRQLRREKWSVRREKRNIRKSRRQVKRMRTGGNGPTNSHYELLLPLNCRYGSLAVHPNFKNILGAHAEKSAALRKLLELKFTGGTAIISGIEYHKKKILGELEEMEMELRSYTRTRVKQVPVL